MPAHHWSQLGRLENNRVAESKGRTDLPCRDRHWKVPGRDDADDADGGAGHFNIDIRTHRRQLFSAESNDFAGEKSKHLSGTNDFTRTFRSRLSFFAGD